MRASTATMRRPATTIDPARQLGEKRSLASLPPHKRAPLLDTSGVLTKSEVAAEAVDFRLPVRPSTVSVHSRMGAGRSSRAVLSARPAKSSLASAGHRRASSDRLDLHTDASLLGAKQSLSAETSRPHSPELSDATEHVQSCNILPASHKMVSVLGAQFKFGASRQSHVGPILAHPQLVMCNSCCERASKLHHARRALQLAQNERDNALACLKVEREAHTVASEKAAAELHQLTQLLVAHQSQFRRNVERQVAGRRATESVLELRVAQQGVANIILERELSLAEAELVQAAAKISSLSDRARIAEAQSDSLARRAAQDAAQQTELRRRIALHDQRIPQLRLALLRLGADAAQMARAEDERAAAAEALHQRADAEAESRAQLEAEVRAMRERAVAAEKAIAQMQTRQSDMEAKTSSLAKKSELDEAQIAELRERLALHERRIPQLRLALLRLGADAAQTARAHDEREAAFEALRARAEEDAQARAQLEAEARDSRRRAIVAEDMLHQVKAHLVHADPSARDRMTTMDAERRCYEAEARCEAADKRIRVLSSSLKLQEAKLGPLNTELERLRRLVVEAEAEASRAEDRLVDEGKRARQLENELVAAKMQLKDMARGTSKMSQENVVRELLDSIRVSVMAPCVKIVVDGEETLRVGGPSQLDFEHVRRVIEAEILSRWTRVCQLGMAKNEAAGASSIADMFPELDATMVHVTREVSERLLTMIKAA